MDRLSIHHIGARGESQAFPRLDKFETSIVNVLYEADAACIDELRNIHASRPAKVLILPYCISGKSGRRAFHHAFHGFGSSLLEAEPKYRDLYIPAHWIDYDYSLRALCDLFDEYGLGRIADLLVCRLDACRKRLSLPESLLDPGLKARMKSA